MLPIRPKPSSKDTFKIPVTKHLHDIRQLGRVNREQFESHIEERLSEFDLSHDDRERAVRECVREMRGEDLITR
jgi:hypothetical protein